MSKKEVVVGLRLSAKFIMALRLLFMCFSEQPLFFMYS
jgi:hypothetical protein